MMAHYHIYAYVYQRPSQSDFIGPRIIQPLEAPMDRTYKEPITIFLQPCDFSQNFFVVITPAVRNRPVMPFLGPRGQCKKRVCDSVLLVNVGFCPTFLLVDSHYTQSTVVQMDKAILECCNTMLQCMICLLYTSDAADDLLCV